VTKTYIREHHFTKGVFYLYVKRATDAVILLEQFYRDATIWLPRKRKAFEAVAARHNARLNTRMDKLFKELSGQQVDCRVLQSIAGITPSSAGYILRQMRKKGRIIKNGTRLYGSSAVPTYLVG